MARDTRNELLVARLAELGLPVTAEELEEEAGGSGAGRPHVAAILVRKGRGQLGPGCLRPLAGQGPPGLRRKGTAGPDAGHRTGPRSPGRCLCWLTHCPWACRRANSRARWASWPRPGLVGLEAIYGRYSQEERASLAVMAAHAGLAITGGSDHHGTYKPDLSVGTGRGDLHVPDSALGALKDRLPV